MNFILILTIYIIHFFNINLYFIQKINRDSFLNEGLFLKIKYNFLNISQNEQFYTKIKTSKYFLEFLKFFKNLKQ